MRVYSRQHRLLLSVFARGYDQKQSNQRTRTADWKRSADLFYFELELPDGREGLKQLHETQYEREVVFGEVVVAKQNAEEVVRVAHLFLFARIVEPEPYRAHFLSKPKQHT